MTTAEAREQGISPGRLRRRDIGHPHRGLNRIGGKTPDPDDLAARCREFAVLLGAGQWFSHLTALALWGAPVDLVDDRLHVSTLLPATRPQRVGIIGHRLGRRRVESTRGFAVSIAPAAFVESAAYLSREDLVAVGDFLVTGRREGASRSLPITTLDVLAAETELRARAPGVPRVRWALERIRVGVDSRRETRLRLALVAGGLPEPDTDVPVLTTLGLLHSDLGYPAARIAIEYEGDGHRTDRDQWMYDIARREAMEDAGWHVIRVTARDLATTTARARLVNRIHSALVRRDA